MQKHSDRPTRNCHRLDMHLACSTATAAKSRIVEGEGVVEGGGGRGTRGGEGGGDATLQWAPTPHIICVTYDALLFQSL